MIQKLIQKLDRIANQLDTLCFYREASSVDKLAQDIQGLDWALNVLGYTKDMPINQMRERFRRYVINYNNTIF